MFGKKAMLVSLCALVLGAICLGVGLFLGGESVIYFGAQNGIRVGVTGLSMGITESTQVFPLAEETQEIHLDLNGAFQVEVRSGEQFHLEYSDNVEVMQSGTQQGIYTLQTKTYAATFSVGIHKGVETSTITLYIPVDSQVETLEISCDLGDILIEDLTLASLEVDVEMGMIAISNCHTEALDLSAEMGDIFYSGTISGPSEVTVEMGTVEMEITGEKSQYDIDAYAQLGSSSVTGYVGDSSPQWPMTVTSSVGEVEIVFWENK